MTRTPDRVAERLKELDERIAKRLSNGIALHDRYTIVAQETRSAYEAALRREAALYAALEPWRETARETRRRHSARSPCSCRWCYLADALDSVTSGPRPEAE